MDYLRGDTVPQHSCGFKDYFRGDVSMINVDKYTAENLYPLKNSSIRTTSGGTPMGVSLKVYCYSDYFRGDTKSFGSVGHTILPPSTVVPYKGLLEGDT